MRKEGTEMERAEEIVLVIEEVSEANDKVHWYFI